MDINKITKCEFERAYCKFPPTKLEKFYFKYFSVNTINRNRWLTWVVGFVLLIPFFIGFIGTIANANEKLIEVATITFSLMLLAFALPWIFVWFRHNCRIKKIQKELGVTRWEYDFLVDKFYNEINVNKYIKNRVSCE